MTRRKKNDGSKMTPDRSVERYPGLNRRVLQLVQTWPRKNLNNIDPEELADGLERMSREYTRHRRNPGFLSAVHKAGLMARDEIRKQGNESDSGSSSEASDIELVEYEDTNMVNQSLSGLYAKTPTSTIKNSTVSTPRSTPQVQKKEKKKKNKLQKDVENEGEAASSAAENPEVNIYHSTKSMKDIGGCDKAISSLGEVFLAWMTPEMIYKPIYQERTPAPVRGVLLHGPAKCGKSLLIEVMAGEAGIPILKINSPQIVTGISGESEKKLRLIFDQAVANAPCILFLKAIDTIAARRESSQREMERRIIAQLCACMDDLEQKGPAVMVLIVATTHSLDSIDSSLRSPGRFGREIGLGIPDPVARIAILKVLCQGLGLAPDVDFQVLARNTPGYLGSDLHSLVEASANLAAGRGREIMTPIVLESAVVDNISLESAVPSSTLSIISHIRACKLAGQYPLPENTFQSLRID